MSGHVFDYSGWRPNPADLVAAGVVGVTRYLATPAHSWKVVTKAEYDRTLTAGLPIMLNWEETAGSWREGYNVGRDHGSRARTMARALGHPDERPIIESIDTAVQPSELPTALDYQRGFNDGGGCGPQGVYGTKFVIDACFAQGLVRVGWQAAARAWYGNRPDCALAALTQLTSKSYPQFPPSAYDENFVRLPDWGQHPAPIAPEVPMTDAEMQATAKAMWVYLLKNPGGPEQVPAGDLLWYTNQQANAANINAGNAAAAVAELKVIMDQILAALNGAEFPVTGTVHIGTE